MTQAERATGAPFGFHKHRTWVTALAVALALLGAGCASTGSARRHASTVPTSASTSPTLPGASSSPGSGSANGAENGGLGTPQVLATGLKAPWGIAYLPDGDALISERDTGEILRLHPGTPPSKVMQVAAAAPAGEGGLLGIAVSPTYATDGFVYAYYTAANDNRIVRFALGGREQVLVSGIAKGLIHDGGRLAFGPDGMLYATTGDAGNPPNSQNLASLNGKILRMRPDGTVPADNPFPGSLVYSYGHRNVQGLAWDPSGRLWSAEFGQDTWDELNLIRPGANYGWPVVEGIGDTADGRYTNPVVQWHPAEASPSGLAYWRGSLYLAALRGERLWRVPVDNDGQVGTPQALLVGTYGRLRSVMAAPDGSLWVLTNNTDSRGEPKPGDDRLLRFAP